MASTIIIKNGTGSAVPTSLQQGELALNVDNGSLFYGTAGSSNSVSSSFAFSDIRVETSYRLEDSGGTSRHIIRSQNNEIELGNSNFTDGILLTGNITASNDISASGNIYSDELNVNGTNLKLNGTANYQVISGSQHIVYNSTSHQFQPGLFPSPSGNDKFMTIGGDTNIEGDLTSSAISASGNLICGDIIGGRIEGQWKGVAISSAYLDDDTAHLTTDQTFTGNKTFSGALTASAGLTVAGNISASGYIYSNNVESVLYTFQLNNSAVADTWYGPNSQGPSYYYWNKSYTNYPNTGLSHHNSGYVLPFKAELLSTRFVIQCLNTPTAYVSASLSILDSADFSYPLTTANDANDYIVAHTAGVTPEQMTLANAHHEITNAACSGTYGKGTMIFPRIKVTQGSKNWRGYWELNYKRIK
jgi:hypothetical protein